MKAFFDTSVLVAAFLGDHERHEQSLNALLSFPRKEAAASVHSLAEVFATLTGLPGKHRVGADQVMLFLADIRDRLTLVPLSEQDYLEAIKSAAERGISGGAIYDAVLAQCARKIKAEKLFTWNLRDFQRLDPEMSARVRTP